MRRVAVVVMVLLAGCADEPQAEDDVNEAERMDVAFAGPGNWSVGQFWTWQFHDGSTESWVVTADEGSAWRIDTSSQESAFMEATGIDDFAAIGLIEKSNLNGAEGGQPVKFFDWPLEQNKTWQMTWDGIQFTAVSTILDDNTARVDLTSSEESRWYTYDKTTGWYAQFGAADENGTELWSGKLSSSGAAYTGEYYRWDIHHFSNYEFGVGDSFVDAFEVPEGAEEIWLHIEAYCSPDGVEGDGGAWFFGMQRRGGLEGYGMEPICPHEWDDKVVLTATAGEWDVGGASAGARVHIDVVVRSLIIHTL